MGSKAYLFIGLLGLAACKSQPGSSQPTAHSAPAQAQVGKTGLEISVTGFVENPSYQPPAESDIEIMDAHVEGDSLHLNVRFGGGCAPHEFTGISRGDYAESLPPQLTVFIDHKANDRCKALVYREIALDMVPLRYNGVSEVVVKIHGTEYVLTYRY